MMRALADTSFVVALGNRTDRLHAACAAAYKQHEIIYLPQPILAEIAYMLQREMGKAAVIRFLRQMPAGKYRVVALEPEDFVRTAAILDIYIDTRIDFADASIAAIAERLNVSRILTLDRRDFQIIRPQHTAYFEVLPTLD